MKWPKVINRKNIKKAILAIVIIPLAYDFLVKPLAYMFVNFSGNIWNTFINYYFECAAKSNGFEHISLIAVFLLGSMFGKSSYNESDTAPMENTSANSKSGVIFYIAILLVAISILVFNFEIDRQKQNFDLDIIKITPYAQVSEINMLKSDWVRMKSKHDYDEIEARINTIIEQNNLD